MKNRTESCCFWDHFIIHCLLEIVRNRVPKKVKRTESCFTGKSSDNRVHYCGCFGKCKNVN
jgi:hypothetical protein